MAPGGCGGERMRRPASTFPSLYADPDLRLALLRPVAADGPALPPLAPPPAARQGRRGVRGSQPSLEEHLSATLWQVATSYGRTSPHRGQPQSQSYEDLKMGYAVRAGTCWDARRAAM
jgi:hypothetical protein